MSFIYPSDLTPTGHCKLAPCGSAISKDHCMQQLIITLSMEKKKILENTRVHSKGYYVKQYDCTCKCTEHVGEPKVILITSISNVIYF